MVKEAEKFAEEDKKQKEEAELVNQANSLVYATEKSLKEYGDKVSAGDRASIESELNNLKEAVKNKNADRIKSGMESLQKIAHKLAEEVYKATAAKQSQGGPQAGADAGSGPQSAEGRQGGGAHQETRQGAKDDVIDADFKAEDERKS